MRISLKASTRFVALSALTIIPALGSAGAASANPYVFNSSYIGAGYSAGVTSGGTPNSSAVDGGNIQGRVAIPGVPISVRGSVLFTQSNSAVIPYVTYDIPVANNVNIYTGAGYSFVQKEGQRTPIGNRDAFVVTAGAEAGITPRIVGYGDVKWGVDAYKNSPADSLSFQAGFGYRF